MTKKGIIYETLGSTAGMQIVESQVPGEVRLSGVFGVCGIKNGNNRIYEKANYGKMVSLMQERMKTESILGELEHPNTMNITLENVSHKIEDIKMNEDGTVTGTIRLLDTPKGKIAKAIIEGGAPLYISSRGAGTIDESGHVTLTLLQTYDLVGTPGFSQAKLTLNKDQKFEALNESLENPVWMIVESEDLLGGGDDKKDDHKDDKKDDHKDDHKDDKKDISDDSQKPDNITMKDIKNSVDKLTKKVGELEAELHIAKEAKETAEIALSEALSRVNYAGIQQWIEDEYTPYIQNQIKENIVESLSPNIQNWVVEEFAPQIEKWTINEFGEQVQNWVAKEYSTGVQNWVVEEFAPQIEKWITEEYSNTLHKWITEEFAPSQNATIENNINENLDAFFESQKNHKYDNIDQVLEQLSNIQTAQDAAKILETQQKDKYAGIAIVENMPLNYRPMWEALDDTKKDAIIRESRMYDMTRPGAVEKFWSTRQLTADTVMESKQQPVTKTSIESKGDDLTSIMKRLGGKF